MQNLIVISFCCFLSYLCGSVPFGLLLGKIFGAGDIRKIGSGNIGATNMLRTGRKGLAAVTLVLDMFKGIVGVAVAQGFCQYYYAARAGDFIIAPSIQTYAGVAAVVGHIFPVWLKFKGGKGVATTFGVLLAINPKVGFAVILGWLMLLYMTRTSSLAAMGSIVGAPVLSYSYASPRFTIMTFILAALIFYRHKDNIKRLREGLETKVGEKKDESP